jgi:tetratricopeptide (TPR) repeat protein
MVEMNDMQRGDLIMRYAATRCGSSICRGATFLVLLAMGLGSTACDFLDPTDVENPRTTVDDLAEAEEPTAAMIPGLETQFARMLAATVVATECASDNYSIHGTGLDSSWDLPRDITPVVTNTTSPSTGAYWHAQELKALTTFVLEEIVPGDDTATLEDIAWASYYRGMAYLHLGENFSYAPLEADGVPVSADQILALAVADFQGAMGGAEETSLLSYAGLARASRWLGDQAMATSAALQVLDSDPDFLYTQGYDTNSLNNRPHWYLVSRAIQEMQPLPRLDFLDPKYLSYSAAIPVAKAEEMHLIRAESALAQGNYTFAKEAVAEAIRLARSRGTEAWTDEDSRNNADLTIRPRSSEILVRADADSPFRAGLVQDRFGATTTQYTVSGTSLDADSVEALPEADPDAIWHAFHLARQEILFLEGRRMADLGIRFPIMLREIDQNPNINEGDPGTESVVPGWIPPFNHMDLFDPASPYDADEVLVTTEVTITYDMNRILVQNNVSPFN